MQLVARVFKVTLEKNLMGWKFRAYWTILYMICGKIAQRLNKIDLKRSSNRSFQSHNLYPRVTAFVHTFSFIFSSLRIIFFNFLNLLEINCIPKLCQKYRSPCSFKSERLSYLFTWYIEWKTIPCSRNARALIRLITWLLWTVEDTPCSPEESP